VPRVQCLEGGLVATAELFHQCVIIGSGQWSDIAGTHGRGNR
jgi:hypothetical protein